MSSTSIRQPTTIDTEIEVRYAETDQMGIVHHSNYVIWFEVARTRLCLETGYHYADIERMGYQIVVTRTETRHLRGARYGDTVIVSSRLEKMTSRGLRFAYQVRTGDTLLAEGATEHVWVNVASGRGCRIPAILKAPFQALTTSP